MIPQEFVITLPYKAPESSLALLFCGVIARRGLSVSQEVCGVYSYDKYISIVR